MPLWHRGEEAANEVLDETMTEIFWFIIWEKTALEMHINKRTGPSRIQQRWEITSQLRSRYENPRPTCRWPPPCHCRVSVGRRNRRKRPYTAITLHKIIIIINESISARRYDRWFFLPCPFTAQVEGRAWARFKSCWVDWDVTGRREKKRCMRAVGWLIYMLVRKDVAVIAAAKAASSLQ